MSQIKKFITELKRRNVFKGTFAYLAVSWVLLQVFSTLLPLVEAPLWVLKILTLTMFLGLPIWIIFSWKFDISSEGIKKIEDNNLSTTESSKTIYGLVITVLILGVIFILFKSPWSGTNLNVETTKKNELNDTIKIHEKISSNLIALDYYLKGEFHQRKETLSDIDTAIVYYSKAIGSDPEFAKAYDNLASSYMRKYLSFDPNSKWEEEAYSAAGKALLLNPNLANPNIIRGQFYWSQSHNFAHEEAMNEFKKAILKDPKLSHAYEQLSLVQLHIGLFSDALNNAQKSVELDPGNFRARRFMAETLLFQGKYELALREFKRIPANFAPLPTQSLEALNLFYLNQQEEAIDLLKIALKNDPHNSIINSVYAILLASNEQHIEADQKMKIAFDNSREFLHVHHIYFHFAICSSIMNNKKETVEWLKKAADTGFPNYPLFNSEPNLKKLKGYSDFDELLTELKEKWEYFNTL